MATVKVLSVKAGGSKGDVAAASTADSTTLATALGTDAVMVVFDTAKVTNKGDLRNAINFLTSALITGNWPPA